MNKISLHYSLILVVIIMAYTGLYKEMLMIFTCIFVHELAHIISAKVFHCRVGRITFTMLGGISEIEISKCSLAKKIIILISGIISNVILYIIIKDSLVRNYNLLMICFNILVIYPLDGYQIVENILIHKKIIKPLKYISFLFLIGLFIVAIFLESSGLFIICLFLLFKNISYFNSDYYYLRKVLLSFPFFLTNFTKNFVYNTKKAQKLENQLFTCDINSHHYAF